MRSAQGQRARDGTPKKMRQSFAADDAFTAERDKKIVLKTRLKFFRFIFLGGGGCLFRCFVVSFCLFLAYLCVKNLVNVITTASRTCG